MYRITAILLIVVLIGLNAAAAPMAVTDIRDELGKRGGLSLKMAIMSGSPVISGYIHDQGFVLTMSDCDVADTRCQYLNFKTCHTASGATAGEMLNWANTYNMGKTPGTAYVTNEGNGSLVCVKRDFDLAANRKFGLTESFEWNQTVEKFAAHVDQQLRSKQAREILGR